MLLAGVLSVLSARSTARAVHSAVGWPFRVSTPGPLCSLCAREKTGRCDDYLVGNRTLAPQSGREAIFGVGQLQPHAERAAGRVDDTINNGPTDKMDSTDRRLGADFSLWTDLNSAQHGNGCKHFHERG